MLSSLLERNLNHQLCSLSRLGNTSQPTMMFFYYYNLVANSQPQTRVRADRFCSKQRVKKLRVYTVSQKNATIIRQFKDGYMKVNYQEIIEAIASELKIILSEQRTITRSTKNSNTLLV